MLSLNRPLRGSLNINKAGGVQAAGQLRGGVGGLLKGIHTQARRRRVLPAAGGALFKAALYWLTKYLFASVTFRLSHHRG